MSKNIHYGSTGIKIQERIDFTHKIEYKDRALDALARIYHVKGIAALAVARDKKYEDNLLLSYNIPNITFCANKNPENHPTNQKKQYIEDQAEDTKYEHSSKKTTTKNEHINLEDLGTILDNRIEKIALTLNDLFALDATKGTYASKFNKIFVKILILRYDSLNNETTRDINLFLKESKNNNMKEIKKLFKAYCKYEGDKHFDQHKKEVAKYNEQGIEPYVELLATKPDLYNKTKLYQDVVKIISYYQKMGTENLPTIEILYNTYENFHAEYLLAQNEDSVKSYFGISMLACKGCSEALKHGNIGFRGTHGIFYKGYETKLVEQDLKKILVELSKKGSQVTERSIALNQDNSEDELPGKIFDQTIIKKLLPKETSKNSAPNHKRKPQEVNYESWEEELFTPLSSPEKKQQILPNKPNDQVTSQFTLSTQTLNTDYIHQSKNIFSNNSIGEVPLKELFLLDNQGATITTISNVGEHLTQQDL